MKHTYIHALATVSEVIIIKRRSATGEISLQRFWTTFIAICLGMQSWNWNCVVGLLVSSRELICHSSLRLTACSRLEKRRKLEGETCSHLNDRSCEKIEFSRQENNQLSIGDMTMLSRKNWPRWYLLRMTSVLLISDGYFRGGKERRGKRRNSLQGKCLLIKSFDH